MSYAKKIPPFNHERFLSRVSAKSQNDCWTWIGYINKQGYGVFTMGVGNLYLAHRVSFDLFNQPPRQDLVIDHICRNRSCVNPDHLREVTQRINVTENSSSPSAENKIKTHCPQGHAYNEDNTYVLTTHKNTKGRACRVCVRIAKRKTYDPAARKIRTMRDRLKRDLEKTKDIKVD